MQIEKDTNSELANMKGDKMHTPEFKTENGKLRAIRENLKRKRNFMGHSILHPTKNSLKSERHGSNVKLALKLKKNLKKNLKNFRKFFSSKRKFQQKKFIAIPSTPHNTGQYLISNFAQVRHEKPYDLNSEFIQKDIYENMIEFAEMDELCVTGGSMKGIINSHLFRRDSDDFSTSLSITNTNNTYVTEDEIMTATLECNGNYFSMECDCVYRDVDAFHFENSQTDQFKQKIEEQKKLIEFLMHKIKSQNG
jgi:hypothetical protein